MKYIAGAALGAFCAIAENAYGNWPPVWVRLTVLTFGAWILWKFAHEKES